LIWIKDRWRKLRAIARFCAKALGHGRNDGTDFGEPMCRSHVDGRGRLRMAATGR